MKIKPLSDRVVIKAIEAIQKTSSGIVIPDTAKEKPAQGEVMAVGPGKTKDGKKVQMSVKIGDKVLYSKYSPQEIKVDGQEYLIISEEDILAVIQ